MADTTPTPSSATTFYHDRDGNVLARIRNGGASVPEVWFPTQRKWSPWPDLDTWHDARPITVAEALELAPGITTTELNATPSS